MPERDSQGLHVIAHQDIDIAALVVVADVAVVSPQVQGILGTEYFGSVAGIDPLEVSVFLQPPVEPRGGLPAGQHAPQSQHRMARQVAHEIILVRRQQQLWMMIQQTPQQVVAAPRRRSQEQ